MDVFNTVVAQLVNEVIAASYQRKPKKEEILDKLNASVSLLVSDAMGILQTGKAWASIHRNTNWYSNNHYPLITARIHNQRVYPQLIELGYLRRVKKGYSFGPVAGKPERYVGTDKLYNLFPCKQEEIPAVLPPTPRGEVIRVQETIITDKVDKNGIPIKETRKLKYTDTPNSNAQRNNLVKINKVLSSYWVDLDITEDQYSNLEKELANLDSPKEAKHPDTINLANRNLYRVYNSIDFKKGGRFYGGWWQGIPSEYRAHITIDGKPTVEYDYSGLHPAMLYAKEGLPVPAKPYEAIIAKLPNTHGVDLEALRKDCKRCFNAMINAENDMERSPKGVKLSKYNGLKWAQMKAAIMEVHEPIRKYFFTGIGLELQRIDSDIAEEVMLHFANSGEYAPVLPVHDSFIMHHGYERELKAIMNAAFKKRFSIKVGLNMKPKTQSIAPKDLNDIDVIMEANTRPCYLRFEAFKSAYNLAENLNI